MSRAEKVNKLANAIRNYRGSTASPAGADYVFWRRPPKLSAYSRVMNWLRRLGMDERVSMSKIQAFKSYEEFNTWLRAIN